MTGSVPAAVRRGHQRSVSRGMLPAELFVGSRTNSVGFIHIFGISASALCLRAVCLCCSFPSFRARAFRLHGCKWPRQTAILQHVPWQFDVTKSLDVCNPPNITGSSRSCPQRRRIFRTDQRLHRTVPKSCPKPPRMGSCMCSSSFKTLLFM